MFFALQIVEVEMPFDKTKNQRKGFCFITFESEPVVQELLKSPKQSINGKEVIHDIHFIIFVLMGF
jgi:RNA recognition motif-containing protein